MGVTRQVLDGERGSPSSGPLYIGIVPDDLGCTSLSIGVGLLRSLSNPVWFKKAAETRRRFQAPKLHS